MGITHDAETANPKWLAERLSAEWASRLDDEWRTEKRQLRIQAERVAKSIMDLAPRMPWAKPTNEQMTDWAKNLAPILPIIFTGYSFASEKHAEDGKIVDCYDSWVFEGKFRVRADQNARQVYNRPAAWRLIVGRRTFAFSEEQAALLNDGLIAAAAERDAQKTAHFAQPVSDEFIRGQKPKLEGEWSKNPRIRDSWEQKELLEARLRDPNNQPQADDSARSNDSGGWNALGTSYIGGSGNPYDSWSP